MSIVEQVLLPRLEDFTLTTWKKHQAVFFRAPDILWMLAKHATDLEAMRAHRGLAVVLQRLHTVLEAMEDHGDEEHAEDRDEGGAQVSVAHLNTPARVGRRLAGALLRKVGAGPG